MREPHWQSSPVPSKDDLVAFLKPFVQP